MKSSWAQLLAQQTALLGTHKKSLSTVQPLKQSKRKGSANTSMKNSAVSSKADVASKQQQTARGKTQKKASKGKSVFSKTAPPDPVMTQAVQAFIATAIPRSIDDYLHNLTLLTVNMQAAKGLSNTIVEASRILREGQNNDRAK